MAQRSGSVSRAETVVSHYERPAVSTHHFMTVSIVCHFVVVCICCFIRSSSIFMYRGTKIASYHRGQTTCLTCQRRTTKKQRKCPILSFFHFSSRMMNVAQIFLASDRVIFWISVTERIAGCKAVLVSQMLEK